MPEKAKEVSSKSFNEYLVEFETKLDEILGKKAPQLPANVKEFIVKYGPYLAVLSLILMLPVLLAALGLAAVVSPFMALGGVNAFAGFSISTIFMIITLVLEVMAIPGLFKRSIKSWRLMLYATAVNAVGALLAMNFGSLIIGTLLSWYVLFQVKSYYK
jgi:hypothetical protein